MKRHGPLLLIVLLLLALIGVQAPQQLLLYAWAALKCLGGLGMGLLAGRYLMPYARLHELLIAFHRNRTLPDALVFLGACILRGAAVLGCVLGMALAL